MKNIALTLAVVAVLGLMACTIIFADVAPSPRPKPTPKITNLIGKIATTADEKGVVEVAPSQTKAGEKVENVKVATDDKTVVTIDGKEAKMGDLKEGMSVVVTPAKGTAAKIAVCTKTQDNTRISPKD
ncbi:MAG: hypothetical protein HZA50_05925 [Planctomycetes bacterium]|nr:hypothetical protein [Planctomycetota bacterium]